VPALSPDEARALTEQARREAAALWRTLLRLHAGGAHLALGYGSWADYCRAELGKGKAEAYRLLAAGRVEAELSLHVETAGMTGAQARVFAPLPPGERVRLAEAVEAAGGFDAVSAPALRRMLDELRGRRRVAGGAVAWDGRTVAAARSALRRLERARRPTWADPDALRALPAAHAARVRAEVAEALRDVGAARRLTEGVLETLDAARAALDARGDLPPPPPALGASWEGYDAAVEADAHRQMSVRDALDRGRPTPDPAPPPAAEPRPGRRPAPGARPPRRRRGPPAAGP
jgi:hypothetical protein